MYIYIWHFLICCLVQNAPFGPRQCLRCHTAGTLCCVVQLTCLLHDTGDMSAARHSRHVCCASQETCLLFDTADVPAE